MIKIGKIVNTHGIRGDIRVLSNSDFKDIRFIKGNKLSILKGKEYIEIEVENHFVHKNFDVIKLKGYNNINDVIQFKNCFIYGDELEEEVLEDDEYFISDLEGLTVYDQNNNKLGDVIEVIDNTSQMLLKIKQDNNKIFYVPFVDEFIIEIDIENNKIIIEVIKGLIDED